MLTLVGALLDSPAGASDSVAFEWDAPAACPAPDDVRTRVESRLGAPLQQGRERRLDVIARVRRGETGGWTLRIWFITDDGTRRRDLEDDDCTVLADAAAAVIAVNVDALSPRTDQSDPEPDPAPDPEPDPEPEPEPDPEPEPEPDPDPEPEHEPPTLITDLRFGGGAGIGPLPAAQGGASVLVALSWGGFRLETGPAVWAAGKKNIGAVSNGRASFQLVGAQIRAGYAWSWPRVEVALTGGIEAAAMLGATEGLAENARGVGVLLAVVVAPTLTLFVHRRVGLWLGAEGLGVPLRPRFVVDGIGTVHRAAPAGVRVLAGVGIRFGADRHEPRGRSATQG